MKKRKFKRHLSLKEIKKLFSDPYSLQKTIKKWKEAEKRGLKFIETFKILTNFKNVL